MFRAPVKNIKNGKRIRHLMASYEHIAKQNPLTLKQVIDPQEVWRFFIDGQLQNGRGLIEGNFFKDPTHLHLTVKDYIEQVEGIEIKNEDNYSASPLWQFMQSKQWSLKPVTAETLTLKEILALDRGWLPFEINEPGYIRALIAAYHIIFNFDVELNNQFIKHLHALATAGVKQTEYGDGDGGKPGEFRKDESAYFKFGKIVPSDAAITQIYERDHSPISFCLTFFDPEDGMSSGSIRINRESIQSIRQYVSDKKYSQGRGITHFSLRKFCESHDMIEFLRQIKENKDIEAVLIALGETTDDKDVVNCLGKLLNTPIMLYSFNLESFQPLKTRRTLTETMDRYLDVYRESLAVAITPIDKLLAIIRFIQACERLHPFIDANTRTFSMLLLNHLLMRNGFPPVILTNPNLLGLTSDQEALGLIVEGMENTLQLAQGHSLFNVDTRDILDFLGSNKNSQEQFVYFQEVMAMAKENNCPRLV